jgi:multisubunit Na+/H+ antiporter MnhF subunit
VNAFTVAATALLCGYLPLGYVVARRRPIDGLLALELTGTIGVLVLLCFAEGFHRSFVDTVAIMAALVSWMGGMVFARFLGRWM